ncbi:MAG: hypothetical protein KZQ67_16375, partial [gamma proteobacterium symbiont of Bathyaustriella thionipta]|nr:hypothetical protein [gamma proteobacterium symbiont of Bathyaustriella thionipta]
IKDYKFKKSASTDFFTQMAEPVTKKLEKQTEKTEEQTRLLEAIPEQLKALPKSIVEHTPMITPMVTESGPAMVYLDRDINYDAIPDFPKVSVLYSSGDSENLNEQHEKAGTQMKKLAPQVARAKTGAIKKLKGRPITPEFIKEMEDAVGALGQYRKNIEAIIAAQPMLGKGQYHRNPYKIGNNGRYGNLQIDVPNLTKNKRLIVHKGGSIVMNEKVDSDLIDLLTKRIKTKKKYSNLSQDVFKRLTDLSGLPSRKRSKKFKNIIKGGCIPTFYNDSDDLIDFLELILGSIDAGNNSINMKNKGIAIIDELLKLGAINKDVHEILYKQNFI